MTEDFGLLKNSKFFLQQKAAHELAKICWGNFVLRESINVLYIDQENETEILKIHRNKVLNNLSHILNSLPKAYYADLPKLITDKVVKAVFNLYQGYEEALLWEVRCQEYLPFTIFNPVTAGKYQADRFIDPSGHFNDFTWAKQFVMDEDQFVDSRFEFACIYCFEDEIIYLSNILKSMSLDEFSWESMVEKWKSLRYNLIRLWVFQIENRFDELIEMDKKDDDDDIVNTFHILGFRDAGFSGHEYAARFFWTHCSSAERHLLITRHEVSRYLKYLTTNPQFIHFIYSDLTKDDRYCAFFYMDRFNYDHAAIWACLLFSPYYKGVLDDILNYPYSLSIMSYRSLFNYLANKMKKSETPMDKEIFKKLWSHLSDEQQIEILEEEGKEIFRDLSKIQAIDLMEIMIQPLPISVKDDMFFYDWTVGMSALAEFSNQDAKDMIASYLLFFLFNFDPVTLNKRLRVDASDFLHRLHEEVHRISSIEESIKQKLNHHFPIPIKDKICEVIDSLQEGINALNNLFSRLEGNNFI